LPGSAALAPVRDPGPPPIRLDAVPFSNDPHDPSKPPTYPVAILSHDRVVIYQGCDRGRRRSSRQRDQFAQIRSNTYKGYLARSTRSRIEKVLGTWLTAIKYYRRDLKRQYDPGRAYPVFATLTLPSAQVHSDREITKACMSPFLIRLRREYGVDHYFWRAEAQANGRIHYHMILDRYIPADQFQMLWNLSTNALGYLDRYFEETGSIYPPSCDLVAVRDHIKDPETGKVRRVDPVKYLLKYALKDPRPERIETESGAIEGEMITEQGQKARPIEGRVWGMSDTLRDLQPPRAEATLRMINALEQHAGLGDLRKVQKEHVAIYYGRIHEILGKVKDQWRVLLTAYHYSVFATLYPGQINKATGWDHVRVDLGNTWLDLADGVIYDRLTAEQLQDQAYRQATTTRTEYYRA